MIKNYLIFNFDVMIHTKSQCWLILDYMQKHKQEIICATDFMWICLFKPFIWYSSNSRLSELKKMGLVEMVWYKKWFKFFFKKSRDRLLFKITEKGLLYKLR